MRRFQQDDAHMPGQVQEEVIGALKFVYTEYSVALSTKPKKAVGSKELWDIAEGSLKNALELELIPYTINHGDGAFYGPKIDIRLTDAFGRKHQCGTIQLHFQLPLRFNLQYKTASRKERQVLSQLDHNTGKWLVWLSLRHVMICPVSHAEDKYAGSRLDNFCCNSSTQTWMILEDAKQVTTLSSAGPVHIPRARIH